MAMMSILASDSCAIGGRMLCCQSLHPLCSLACKEILIYLQTVRSGVYVHMPGDVGVSVAVRFLLSSAALMM